jgi:hypothetical protein
MRSRDWARWAVAGVLAALVAGPVAAQEGPPALEMSMGVGSEKATIRIDPREGTLHLDAEGGGPFHAGTLFLEAEYLYWQPRRRDLDFALVSPGAIGLPLGDVASLRWERDHGGRVGLGYGLPEDGVSIAATYTYFHSSDSAFVARPADGTLFATAAHPVAFVTADTAAAQGSLNYNVGDLMLYYRLVSGCSFHLCLGGGLRYASVHQGFDVTYDGAGNGAGAVAPANQAQVHNPTLFDGGGFRAGIDWEWCLPHGLSVYGRTHGALVLGRMKSEYLETNNAGATTIALARDNFDTVVPVLDMGMGVAYQVRNMRLRVGYELANWFGLVSAPDFVDDTHPGKIKRRAGDLTLDGLVVQFDVSF